MESESSTHLEVEVEGLDLPVALLVRVEDGHGGLPGRVRSLEKVKVDDVPQVDDEVEELGRDHAAEPDLASRTISRQLFPFS